MFHHQYQQYYCQDYLHKKYIPSKALKSDLSKDNPQAMTRTSSGSPIGRNISGRNIPLLPISVHFFSSDSRNH